MSTLYDDCKLIDCLRKMGSMCPERASEPTTHDRPFARLRPLGPETFAPKSSADHVKSTSPRGPRLVMLRAFSRVTPIHAMF